jgi:hypothetical protein
MLVASVSYPRTTLLAHQGDPTMAASLAAAVSASVIAQYNNATRALLIKALVTI